MQQPKPLNILERAMQAIHDSQPSTTFKPTPYERKVMERSVGLLKSCGLAYIRFSWVLHCDNAHALHITLHHAPNADKRLEKAIKAMGGAFRRARAKAATTACSVDGYKFEFPSVILEFFTPRHMGKRKGAKNEQKA